MISDSNSMNFERIFIIRNIYINNLLSGISISSLNSIIYIMKYLIYAYYQIIERIFIKISDAIQIISSYRNIDLIECLHIR